MVAPSDLVILYLQMMMVDSTEKSIMIKTMIEKARPVPSIVAMASLPLAASERHMHSLGDHGMQWCTNHAG